MVKVILCYGGSNTRGFIPGSFDEKTWLHRRYPKEKRWTGVLQKNLGSAYEVIEEGLAGRTTNLDELNPNSIKFSRNGLKEILTVLDTHYPIDLVIFDLGNNDAKIQFKQPTEKIVEGMQRLVQAVKSCFYGPQKTVPKILVTAPAPWQRVSGLSAMMAAQYTDEVVAKTKSLPVLYEKMCLQEKVAFFDVSSVVTTSQIDGVHLDEAQHYLLGVEIAKKVARILM